MASDGAKDGTKSAELPAALQARRVLLSALKAALATLDHDSGAPYASLITVATLPDATPVFLISTLARHTQNLLKDPRASILIDGTGNDGDPLAGGRVSLYGRAELTTDPLARARFLARHPNAEIYAGFKDFNSYRLKLEGAHFVGGFGSIHDLSATDLRRGMSGA